MKKKEEFKFKFSVVSAVYNVEAYLDEMIKSLVKQDIGFIENVQLILVDDGSPDNSGKICDKWQKLYPNNIFVVHKANAGVSAARNSGLELVQGKYFNFIDSDDLFTKNTFSDVWKFFEKNENEIDVACVPLFYFEAKEGEHPLNTKFHNGTRVIDLKTEPTATLLHCSSSFFHNRVKDKFRFDTKLSLAEDVKYVSQILLEKQKFGVVSTCKYLYRQRLSGNSAINTSQTKENWYLPVLNFCLTELLDYAKENNGAIPKFLENAVLSDLRWKLNQSITKNIYANNPEKLQEYKTALFNCFRKISTQSILEHKNFSAFEKYYILKEICGRNIEKFISSDDNERFICENNTVFYVSNCLVRFQFFEMDKQKIKITFSIDLVKELEKYIVKVKINGIFYNVKLIDKIDEFYKIDNIFYKRYYYYFELDKSKMPFYFSIYLYDSQNKKFIQLGRQAFEKYFPLNNVPNSYFATNDMVLKRISKYAFTIKKCSKLKKVAYELLYDKSLLKLKQLKPLKLIAIRWYYKFYKLFHKKKVWLISDRLSKAGDNGEAFFRFLKKSKVKNVKYKFAISKGEDYKKLSKLGDVINFRTKKYYKTYLVADDIISSQAEEEINLHSLTKKEPFLKDLTYYKNFVFLQHGVTNNDMSGWLNKFNKNIMGLITTSQKESDIFLNTQCFYDESKIWLTGFARFDRLENNPQKIISITPTWRKNLTNGVNPETRNPYIVDNFKNSAYFKFYNSLINDKKLLKTCKEYGYKLQFAVHPMLIESVNLFKKNKFVEILDKNINYSKLFSESNLLITDYSSTIYDFVYLGKPIIYTQFDKEEMINSSAHTYNVSYNNYEEDGFGEVCYTYNEAVKTIIEYIKNDCKLKDKYAERINNLYAFRDKNNCKRIYDKIVDLDKSVDKK